MELLPAVLMFVGFASMFLTIPIIVRGINTPKEKLSIVILIIVLGVALTLVITGNAMHNEDRNDAFEEFKTLSCTEQQAYILENDTSSERYLQHYTIKCLEIRELEK